MGAIEGTPDVIYWVCFIADSFDADTGFPYGSWRAARTPPMQGRGFREPEWSLPMPRTLEQNIRAVTDYLLEIERAGTPYHWWREGDSALGVGPPAHAVDRDAPRPET